MIFTVNFSLVTRPILGSVQNLGRFPQIWGNHHERAWPCKFTRSLIVTLRMTLSHFPPYRRGTLKFEAGVHEILYTLYSPSVGASWAVVVSVPSCVAGFFQILGKTAFSNRDFLIFEKVEIQPTSGSISAHLGDVFHRMPSIRRVRSKPQHDHHP